MTAPAQSRQPMRHVLPVIERELRVRARRPLTHWMRLGVAAAGSLLVLTSVSAWSTGAGASQPNSLAFHVLAWFGFLLALAAAFLTMDAISSERREGTLGLLFLTELSGLDVVIGKLAAASLMGVYLFLGFAPILTVARLPGGVTGGEVVRFTFVIIETMLLALALGLAVSARTQDLLSAARRTVLCLVMLLLVPAMIGPLQSMLGGPALWLSLLSPVTTFGLSDALAYGAAPLSFWASALLLLAETAGLLVFAGRSLDRNWRDEEPHAISIELPVTQARRPPIRLGDADPIPWLVHRQRRHRTLFWIAAGLMSLIGSLGWFTQILFVFAGGPAVSAGIFPAFVSAFAILGNAAALGVFALATGRFFLDSRQTGALELLLSTPLGARELVGGQKRALRQTLIGPLVIIILPVVATLLLLLTFHNVEVSDLAFWYAAAHLLSAARQALNVVAACWLGLWLGLHCRNAWTLMAWAAGFTAGLQWVVGIFFQLLRGTLGGFSISGSTLPFTFKLLLVLSPLCQLLPALVLIFWANQRITRDLAGIGDTTLHWRDALNEPLRYGLRWLTGLRNEAQPALR